MSDENSQTEGAFRAEVARTVPLLKVDEEKKLVTGVVLEPDEVDAHGDFEKAETIRLAAHKFMATYNEATTLGLQHTVFGDIGVELAESFIAPQDLDFDGQLKDDEIIRKGSWVMTVHVTNDEIWKAIKSGAITGFSIGGIATVAAPAA